MRKLLFKLPLLLLIGIISCTDDSPTEVDPFTAFLGKVVDTEGHPVKDAEVSIVFDIEPYALNDTLPQVNGTGIEQVLPNPFSEVASLLLVSENGGNIRLELHRGSSDSGFIYTFWQAKIAAGSHQITLAMTNPTDSTKNLQNGLYTLAMHHNDSIYLRSFFYNNPLNSGAWAKTDSRGSFELRYEIFKKFPLPRISASGNHLGYFQIGDSATVQIVKNSARTEGRIKIDRTRAFEKTFTIK